MREQAREEKRGEEKGPLKSPQVESESIDERRGDSKLNLSRNVSAVACSRESEMK